MYSTSSESGYGMVFSSCDFKPFVQKCWDDGAYDWLHAASIFNGKILWWKKEVFGNLFLRKKQRQARLLGVQRALAAWPKQFLQNL